ncbi:MAG: hypothetical protein IJZ82_02670 [Lachnospiraceae bacterium]|nr:hypothetical protein [Lachnospiraceae bacterium]
MKKMKKVWTVMLSLCMMFTALCFTKVDVEAAEPVTYTLKVVNGEWRQQVGYPWVENGTHRELYYMFLDMKDGDKLVISDDSMSLNLTVDKRLSNITLEKADNVVIHTPGVDNVYVLNDSVGAINGDVTNGYVYQSSIANFNNNVDYLEIFGNYPLSATVSVIGTVNHVKAYDSERTHFEFYNFESNSLRISQGALKTEVSKFSQTPVVVATPAPAPVTKPSTSAGDELDDVPKTGDFATYYWMFGLAAACLVVGMGLKFASGKEEN